MIIAGTGHRPNKLGGYSEFISLALTGWDYEYHSSW
jgi:hypothetical protein